MPRITIDLKRLKERPKRSRKKAKRSDEVPPGWEPAQPPDNQVGWEDRLGELRHCPIEGAPFDENCVVAETYQDALDLIAKKRGPFTVYRPGRLAAEHAKHESLTANMDDYSRNSPNMNGFIGCGRCGNVSAASRWYVRTRHRKGGKPHEIAHSPVDVDPRVAGQQRLADRAEGRNHEITSPSKKLIGEANDDLRPDDHSDPIDAAARAVALEQADPLESVHRAVVKVLRAQIIAETTQESAT